MIQNTIFVILGFLFLIKGADYLVESASFIAQKFKIPDIIIGITIVSIGTSLPELIVSITAGISNHSDMVFGNVIGSNISNLFLIFGICSILKPIKFKEEAIRIEIPYVIFLTALLYILSNNKDFIISRKEGSILIFLCILFIIYNIWIFKKIGNEILVENKKNNIYIEIFKIFLGIILLKYGGDFIVENLSTIANNFGISEKVIGLTIISISTSFPELITSIVAIKKGKEDIGIGNIMGSNIFNIVLILGITSIINPIKFAISYNKEIILFLFGIILLEVFCIKNKKEIISKMMGICLVGIYGIYMLNVIFS